MHISSIPKWSKKEGCTCILQYNGINKPLYLYYPQGERGATSNVPPSSKNTTGFTFIYCIGKVVQVLHNTLFVHALTKLLRYWVSLVIEWPPNDTIDTLKFYLFLFQCTPVSCMHVHVYYKCICICMRCNSTNDLVTTPNFIASISSFITRQTDKRRETKINEAWTLICKWGKIP